MKKIISLVLALVLLVCVMAGCGEKIDKKAVAITVNGQEANVEFYNFYLTQLKKNIAAQMNSSDMEIEWEEAELEGKKLIETAKEKAVDEVVSALVIEQKAEERGIKLTKEEEAAISQQISDKKLSQTNFDKWLQDHGLTEDIYKRVVKINYLTSKLNQQYSENITDAEINDYYHKNIARVKHILVMTVDENQQPLSAAEVAEKKAYAEELLNRVKNGENFDDLVAQYSEDPGSKSQPEGYYLGKGFVVGGQGSMVPEFETMSLALEVGGVSEPVETTYGYHIIKRYENAPEVLEANKEQIKSYAMVERFADALDKWKTSAKVEVNQEIINKL